MSNKFNNPIEFKLILKGSLTQETKSVPEKDCETQIKKYHSEKKDINEINKSKKHQNKQKLYYSSMYLPSIKKISSSSGKFSASKKELAKIWNVSLSSSKLIIKKLINFDLILVEQEANSKQGSPTIYRLVNNCTP